MSDTVMDKLVGACGDRRDAEFMLGHIAEAELVIFDPADPAVIDRVAEAIALEDYPTAPRPAIEYHDHARAVLAALGGDRPAPSLSVQRRLDVMRGDQ